MCKKKLVTILALASMIVGSFGLTACGGSTNDTNAASAQTGQESEVTDGCTVTIYDSDGTTVLDTVSVAKGEKAQLTEPTKEGYTFMGWYATPGLTRTFDTETVIKQDTKVYAGFAQYAEDTRDFYIVGFGESEVLAESNWGAVTGDAQKMTKEDNAEANVYTITVQLEAGDQFQFAMDGTWADQRGFGYLTSTEQDGVEYFKNAGALGDANVKKSNIEVAVAGSYTFTLTTYPAEDVYDTEDEYYTEETKENFNMSPYDTISFVYNGQ